MICASIKIELMIWFKFSVGINFKKNTQPQETGLAVQVSGCGPVLLSSYIEKYAKEES